MEFVEWLMRAGKWILGVIAGIWGLLFPLHTLIVCVVVAISIDFVIGNIADYYRHKRAGERYTFQSEKMWKTCWKLGLSIIGIGFAWMLDAHILAPVTKSLNLANFFSAFVVGAEFWSYLENAAVISDHPIFRSLRRYMKDEVKKKVDINFDADENKQAL